jgi:hypothetical protein
MATLTYLLIVRFSDACLISAVPLLVGVAYRDEEVSSLKHFIAFKENREYLSIIKNDA